MIVVDDLTRPITGYHSHADLIWPDDPFKIVLGLIPVFCPEV